MELLKCVSCGSTQLVLQPDNTYVCQHCGCVYTTDMKPKPVLTQDKKDAKVLEYCNKALACRQKNDTAGETSWLVKALEVDDRNADVLNQLGRAYRESSNPYKAIECYLKALEINPNFALAYCNLGLAYITLGEYEKAKSYYEKGFSMIVVKDANYATALANYGYLLCQIGKKREGLKTIKKAEKYGYNNGDKLRAMLK